MEYTRDQKRKKFELLPEDLKEAILSVDTSEKLAAIREKNSLMIDQAGELGDELGLFMLGFTKQDDFVKNLSKRLNIPNEKAIQISLDINRDILDAVRSSLQKIQTNPEEKTSAVPTHPLSPDLNMINSVPIPKPASVSTPKPAPLIVEQRPPSNSPVFNDSTLKKEDVLNDLENIEKLKPATATNFVEHLLSNPVSKPEQVEIKKIIQTPAPEQAPAPTPKVETKPRSTIDPYREQV